MNPGDYWYGLTLSWWLLCRDGSVCAASPDLAGLWHDDGARAVMLGTYADAKAAAERLYGGQTASPTPPVAVEVPPQSIPETLFEQREVA
jgi:hypothetical protein